MISIVVSPAVRPLRIRSALSLSRYRQFIILVAVVALLALAAFLALRRGIGAFHEPLDAPHLLALGVGLAAGCHGLRLLIFVRSSPSFSWPAFLSIAPSLIAWLASISLTIPGSGWLGTLGLWIPLLTVEMFFWRGDGLLLARAALRSSDERPSERAPAGEFSAGDTGRGRDEPESNDTPLPADVLQRITRFRTAVGQECARGHVRAEFAVQQRCASVYVALCPPLPGLPEVAVEQCEGPSVEIQCAQVYSHGVRFDLRRATDFAQSATVVIEFLAGTITACSSTERGPG